MEIQKKEVELKVNKFQKLKLILGKKEEIILLLIISLILKN